jgi:hypothetical protein
MMHLLYGIRNYVEYNVQHWCSCIMFAIFINHAYEEYTNCLIYPKSRNENVISIHLLLLFKTGPSCVYVVA